MGRVGIWSDSTGIRPGNLVTPDRIMLKNPLSDWISDPRLYKPKMHRIVFGQAQKKVGSDIGQIDFGTGLSDYPVICDWKIQ